MIADLSDYIYGNPIIYGIGGLILSTLLSMCFVPAFRELAKAKNFTDSPSARKSPSLQAPILGGVAVYLSAFIPILLISIFFHDLAVANTALVLGFGSTTLIVVGVKDDVSGVKPVTKLIFQLCIAVFVIFMNVKQMVQFNLNLDSKFNKRS